LFLKTKITFISKFIVNVIEKLTSLPAISKQNN
jgi:hypothetical protein